MQWKLVAYFRIYTCIQISGKCSFYAKCKRSVNKLHREGFDMGHLRRWIGLQSIFVYC